MKFANERVEREWRSGRLNPLLFRVLTEACDYAFDRWGWEFTITCIYRTPDEDAKLGGSGIHTLWRAVDVRTRDVHADAINDVATTANAKWKYDPERPAIDVMYVKPHGTAPHAHMQTHPRTKRA